MRSLLKRYQYWWWVEYFHQIMISANKIIKTMSAVAKSAMICESCILQVNRRRSLKLNELLRVHYDACEQRSLTI